MKKISLFLVAITLLFSSCDYSKVTSKPGSTGITYELLVVLPDHEWDGEVGKTIRDFFNQPDTTMFMVEPLYKTPHINETQLTNNEMFKYFKSILIVEIEPGRTAKIETQDTLWAKPQRIFKIVAPDEAAFVEIFDKHKEYILESYTSLERDKLNVYFETALNKPVMKQVGEKFNYTFNITTGFYVAKDPKDFMWLRSETSKSSTSIMIYVEDYISEAQLTESYIVFKRNLETQQHVPASLDGSYVKVSDVFPLTTKHVNFNGMFATEVRGAWDAHNDVMGGTFLNYTIVDEVNNKILTLDGFIYAPNKEKRVLMMQLEALLWSLRAY